MLHLVEGDAGIKIFFSTSAPAEFYIVRKINILYLSRAEKAFM